MWEDDGREGKNLLCLRWFLPKKIVTDSRMEEGKPMDKKAIRYWGLILSALLLTQRPFAAAGSIPTATPSTVEKQSANTVRAYEGERDARNDVIRVVMPVDVEHVFDFIMDPQELIAQTEAAAYDGSRFEEDATLFFKRSDEEAETDYSSASDSVTIANKGEEDVMVTVTARISPDSISGIMMSDDPEFPDDEEASLYLALTDGDITVPVDIENGAVIEADIPGVFEGEEPNEYSFQLIGAVNRNGDWSEAADVVPEITVTWRVSAYETDELDEYLLDEIGPEAKEGLSDTVEGDEPKESKPAENSDGTGENGVPSESSTAAEQANGESGSNVEESVPAESNGGGGDSTAKNDESSSAGESSTGKHEEGIGADGSNTAESGGSSSPGGSTGGNGEGVIGENPGAEEGGVSGGDTGKNEGSSSEENAGKSEDSSPEGNAGKSEGSVSEENTGKNEGSAFGENTGENKAGALEGNTGGNESGIFGESAGRNGSSVIGENAGENGGSTSRETAREDKGGISEGNLEESGGSISKENV